tara:strand:- start:31 stop:639 length:609 start_codon:yes stop_codon:yes gene_type:complete
MLFKTPNQELYSLKTSRGSSVPNSKAMSGATPQELRYCSMSAESWKGEVTKRRGEYSVRRKSAHLNKESGCSSAGWPTPSARDGKGGYQMGRIRNGKVSMDTLDAAVNAHRDGGLLAPDTNSTDGKSQESWPTPTAAGRGVRNEKTMAKCLKFRKSKGKNSVPLYLEEKVQGQVKGFLNPSWVEQLMGLPADWTRLSIGRID